VAVFRQGLAEAGAIEGKNFTIEYRWANGEYDRLHALATELVERHVAVLATVGGDPSALAAKAATATIPIVATFTSDPIELGLVASLGRPEGNITGISLLNATLEAKRLGLLHDLLPQATKLAVLVNPTFPSAVEQLNNLQAAARASNLRLEVLNARTDAEIEAAFETIRREGLQALTVTTDSFFVTRRVKLAGLVARHKVPAMFSLRAFVADGGLASYGIDLPDLYRQAGVYVARILRGSKPADLPIVQPTKFELVINRKAAKLLGLSLSPDLLSIADEVIE
ncbi:MAG TPA: ABC transporter substrate-binding protein, partial [Bradyrhizobium sp.]|nr:ABC transporter substrate-binding protein [Bradyrhizobium sp.]